MSKPKTAERPLGESRGNLERALGLTFNDPRLLEQALTHRSYVHEHPDAAGGHNERLEFLGDAIFQFLVAETLYSRFPEAPEGELSALRAAVVSTESFAAVGEALDLAGHILASRGEASLAGRGRPAIMAGCVEAIVAAAYLDSGIDQARKLVDRLIEPRLDAALDQDEPLNVKGRLQELIQARDGITPRYRVVDQSGPIHASHFVVEVVAGDRALGRGEGIGKREAEQRAARAALAALDEVGQPSDSHSAGREQKCA
jgi:ribonuclease III